MNEANYVALHENNFPSYFFVKDELTRGRVDICYNGSYESVCSDIWKEEEASVICQQLGFSQYGESIHYDAYHSPYLALRMYVTTVESIATSGSPSPGADVNVSIYLDNIVCRGDELTLLMCGHNPVGEHNCDHTEDAGVRCQGG